MNKILRFSAGGLMALALAAPAASVALAAGGNHMNCRAQISWVMRYVHQVTGMQEKTVMLSHLKTATQLMNERREEACVAEVATVKQMLGVPIVTG